MASSIATKSGRAMIEALIDGERRGQVLAQLAKGPMRAMRSRPAGQMPGDGRRIVMGVKIPDREIKNLEKQNVLRRHEFHGEWNYCLVPGPT